MVSLTDLAISNMSDWSHTEKFVLTAVLNDKGVNRTLAASCANVGFT